MPIASQLPLSFDELAELDSFLLADPDERLAVDVAHGFLTALLVKQKQHQQKACLADVWGAFPATDTSQRQRMTALLLRMRNDIAAMLENGHRFEPLILEEEDDEGIYEVYDGWCFGFMLAVANDEQRWQDLPQDQQSLLEPIASLALLHTDEEEVEMSDEEYADYTDLLPGSVVGLYGYFGARVN